MYLVDDANERLLDIHLEKLKEYTTSSFTLYAGINMLMPKFVDKLKQHDFIKPVMCGDYIGEDEDRRGAKEHSYYLTQLINTAIKDGMTHIAIFHPDSFPIKIGWDTYFGNKLSDTCVLVSIFPQMSGFTFFNRNYYINNNPRLLPRAQEESSSTWIDFQKENRAIGLVETGMGYAYNAYLKGLSWYKLNRSNRGEYHNHFASIFDDYIFHLGSASEYKNRPMTGYIKDSTYNKIKRSVINSIPISIKNKLKKIIPNKIIYPETNQNKKDYLKIRRLLLNNTIEFLNFILTGDKKYET